MLKKIILLLIVVFVCELHANDVLLSYGVLNYQSNIKGYYFIYSKEKSRKINEFTVELTDENLVSTGKVVFEEEMFYNTKQKNIMKQPQFDENIVFKDNTLFIMLYKVLDNGKYFKKIVLVNVPDKTLINETELLGSDLDCEYTLFSGSRLVKFSKTKAEGYDYLMRPKWSFDIASKEDVIDAGDGFFAVRKNNLLFMYSKESDKQLFSFTCNSNETPTKAFKLPGKTEFLVAGYFSKMTNT